MVSTKGEATRERILDRAFRLAGREGLEGLSIGRLATDVGLSKSGLFAHFGSKEDLQVEVLKTASLRFEEVVVRPAFRQPRGLPRIEKLFENWLKWTTDPTLPGGCLFLAAATELDDREGPPRDFLVGMQRELLRMLAKSAHLAIDAGHFRRDLDCDQFAFELYGLVLAYNYARRLLRDPKSAAHARAGFARLTGAAASKR